MHTEAYSSSDGQGPSPSYSAFNMLATTKQFIKAAHTVRFFDTVNNMAFASPVSDHHSKTSLGHAESIQGDDVADLMGPKFSGGAIVQHLAKLRVKMTKADIKPFPPSREWRRCRSRRFGRTPFALAELAGRASRSSEARPEDPLGGGERARYFRCGVTLLDTATGITYRCTMSHYDMYSICGRPAHSHAPTLSSISTFEARPTNSNFTDTATTGTCVPATVVAGPITPGRCTMVARSEGMEFRKEYAGKISTNSVCQRLGSIELLEVELCRTHKMEVATEGHDYHCSMLLPLLLLLAIPNPGPRPQRSTRKRSIMMKLDMVEETEQWWCDGISDTVDTPSSPAEVNEEVATDPQNHFDENEDSNFCRACSQEMIRRYVQGLFCGDSDWDELRTQGT